MVLLVTSLAKLEKDLSGLCRLADSFGLLDDAKPRRWLQTIDAADGAASSSQPKLSLTIIMALVRLIALLTSLYFMCQYLFRYGPSHLQASLPMHFRNLLAFKNTEAAIEDNSWWRALCLAGPYAVLVVVFAHDLLPIRSRSGRLTLTQILYERHFGIHGRQYDLKVAALQLATVLLQAFGKLHLLGGITIFAIQQDSWATMALRASFWTFWALLLFNSIYPTALPHFSRGALVSLWICLNGCVPRSWICPDLLAHDCARDDGVAFADIGIWKFWIAKPAGLYKQHLREKSWIVSAVTLFHMLRAIAN